MQTTPVSLRLHIGLFGRRNVGKSSLINRLTGQQVAIVSPRAGTTTDPVSRPMELHGVGPVVFVDTAGLDDRGVLGHQRIQRTRAIIDRTDLAVLVTGAGKWGALEDELVEAFVARGTRLLVVANKADLGELSPRVFRRLRETGVDVFPTVATTGTGVEALRGALVELAPQARCLAPALLVGLVDPADLFVLVVPVDKEAPEGRLILPQVQTIRALLDSRASCLVVQDQELQGALELLGRPPRLVVTDSQALAQVAHTVERSTPLTSFSILFARLKADLPELVNGAATIGRLRPGARVLVAEACTHHPIADDIGRIKIPRWLEQRVGGPLQIDYVQGHDFPDDLTGLSLVIHCGACMLNRREMLSRLRRCHHASIPVTNYGLCISACLGLLNRVIEPFSEVQTQVSAPGCSWKADPCNPSS